MGHNKKPSASKRKKRKARTFLPDEFWAKVKMEWVTTPITMVELSEKYNLSFYTVRGRWAKDEWSKALRDYKHTLGEEYENAIKEKAKVFGERFSVFEEHVVVTSEKIVGMVEETIQLLSVKAPVSRIRELSIALRAASDAVKNAQHNVRLSIDKATDIKTRKTDGVLTDEEKDRVKRELSLVKSTATK